MTRERVAAALELALWLGAAAGVLSTARALGSARQPNLTSRSISVALTTNESVTSTNFVDSADAYADNIATNDPFRISRAPASVAYEPGRANESQSQMPLVRPTRPTLAVGGIYGGPRSWHAILLGIPGRPDGVIVQEGDSLGEMRVRRITRDTVVVRASDTVWTMAVRAEWRP